MLGLEGQNKTDIQNTILFAKKLDIDTVSFFIAQPLPGTPFWDYCKKNKLFYKGFDTFHLRYGKSNTKVTGLSAKELEDFRFEGRKQFMEYKSKQRKSLYSGKRKDRYLEKGC